MKRPITYEHFIAVLTSKVTQYDLKESKKHENIYRLGHLLLAVEKVETSFKASYHGSLHDVVNPAGLDLLKQIINKKFIMPFSPASNVVKQIDAYLKSSKAPSLVG